MGMPEPKMSMAEFLAWENNQPERHEFHRGGIFAMVGGTLGHNRTIFNLARAIEDHLAGSPCHVFSESVKVQIADGYLHPDIVVTCEKVVADASFLTEPILIVEVLSATTHGYDRVKKFALYRAVPSLREYALVDPVDRQVETYIRNDRNEWALSDQTGLESIVLDSIHAMLSAERVFKGFEP